MWPKLSLPVQAGVPPSAQGFIVAQLPVEGREVGSMYVCSNSAVFVGAFPGMDAEIPYDFSELLWI